MTTKQHLMFIAILIMSTILWKWPISIGMLYFFAMVNGDIEWKTPPSES